MGIQEHPHPQRHSRDATADGKSAAPQAPKAFGGNRSAETAIERARRRADEKQARNAETRGLTVSRLVDHKLPFPLELIYDRARTTSRVDRQPPQALDSD